MNSILANIVQLHSSRIKKSGTRYADKAEQIRLGRAGSRREGGPYLIEIQRKLQCQVTVSALPPHNRPLVVGVSDPIRVFIRISTFYSRSFSVSDKKRRRRRETNEASRLSY